MSDDSVALSQHQIGARVSNAREYAAIVLLFRGDSGPINFVTNLTAVQLPDAGAAGTVATGAGPTAATLLQGDQ